MCKTKHVAIPKKTIFRELTQTWSHKNGSEQSRFCDKEATVEAETLAELVEKLKRKYKAVINDFKFGSDLGANFLSVTFLRKNPFVKNPELVDLNYLNLFKEGIVHELWECEKIFEIQKIEKINLNKEAKILGYKKS